MSCFLRAKSYNRLNKHGVKPYTLRVNFKNQNSEVLRINVLEQRMIINIPKQDLLSLELHNFNSEDKSSFQELRDFFMQAPVPLAILKGPQYFFTLSNLPFENLIGKKTMGKNISEVFDPEKIKHILPLLDGVYKTGVPYIGKDIPLNLNDENGLVHNKWIDVACHPFRENEEESIKGIFAVFQDVTDRVLAKKIMAKSEEKFRQLANTLPQMVWTATEDGKLDWYNDVWFEFTGGDRSESDETWGRAIHPEDLEAITLAWQEALNNKSLYRKEVRFKEAKTGQYRWYLCQGSPILDEFGVVEKWTGSCNDIHDQKTAFEMLELERVVRERVISTLTHDLRTPLAAAKINAQLLTRKVPTEEMLNKVANRISKNIDRADKMIQDILDASQIKSGQKVLLDINRYDLRELLLEAVEDLQDIHGERIIFVEKEEFYEYIDASALKRMVENLVNNASKYGKVQGFITVTLERLNNSFVISVHNEGEPILEHDQKEIFEPYQRSDTAKQGVQKGWGLGLTLVKGFAEAHGGQVKVKSSLQDGTTFSIIIPQKIEEL